MGSNWKGTAQFQSIRGSLSNLTEHEFARKALPLLALLDPEIQMESRGSSRDRAGIDACAVNADGKMRWAVQFKGFDVVDTQMGADQIAQCRHSIETLRKSRFRPLRYTLLHNRNHRQADFRIRVTKDLEDLVVDGIVEKAELWQLDDLLQNSFNIMDTKLRSSVEMEGEEHLNRVLELEADAAGLLGDVETVPYSTAELDVSRTVFLDDIGKISKVGDPADEIGRDKASHLIIVLGEFGLGKTTLAKRLAHASKLPVIFTPAALLPVNPSGGKMIQSAMLPTERVLAETDAAYRELYERIISCVASKILEQNDAPLAVIVDGLDESQLLASPRGFKMLFDTLVGIRAPIVLTMRGEFWKKRRNEIQAALSDFQGPSLYYTGNVPANLKQVGKHGTKRRRGRIYELELWRDDQMRELVILYKKNGCGSREEFAHVEHLQLLVLEGKYTEYYGDIPRRPLFLKLLLDHVRIHGVAKTGRAKLFQSWIEDKVRRDCVSPRAWNSSNSRIGILNNLEVIDETLALAWECMVSAAGLMHERIDDKVVLKPSIERGDLLSLDPRLAQRADLAGLVLNSLLLPVRSSTSSVERYRFAHIAFQEFLFAWWLVRYNKRLEGSLPDAVTVWCDAIRREAENFSG